MQASSQESEHSRPPFDAVRARQIVALCANPPSETPRDAGLRAAFAVYHRSLFQTDEEAWVNYGSSRQRYYEWKAAVEAVRSYDEIDALSSANGNHAPPPAERNMQTVDGDLRVRGIVYAENFVPTGPPGAPPPPPSPPAESDERLSVTPPSSELQSTTASVPEEGERETNSDRRPAGVSVASAGAVAGAVAGGMGAAPAAVAGVQAIGFGAGGIASGSTAAAIMSAQASAGGVVAGSTTATLQSIGATASLSALGTGPIVAVAAVGAIAGATVLGGGAYLAYKMIAHKPDGQEPEQSEGLKTGKWMVITEEGSAGVRFYSFESQELAWRYFNDSWHARIILNESGEEREAGGVNGLARQNIRKQLGVSPHNSTNGFSPSWLATGKVVALHNSKHNRFVRMIDETVDGKGGPMNREHLPAAWRSERFTVVDAGCGEFAFHSEVQGRFIRMIDHLVDAKGGEQAVDELPGHWAAERFVIVDAGNGLVALHSTRNNRFVKMDGDCVNGGGGRRDAVSLPDSWDSERFSVVELDKKQQDKKDVGDSGSGPSSS